MERNVAGKIKEKNFELSNKKKKKKKTLYSVKILLPNSILIKRYSDRIDKW